MNWLTEPLQLPFMRAALLAALLIGVTCALLGVYVVLRQMAFASDALGHTMLPGLVIAYLNSWNLVAGAMVAGIAAALGIGWFSSRRAVHEDTAIGVIFAGAFAFGVLLMSRTRSFRDFTHMLFGDILGVTNDYLLRAAIITVVIIALLYLFNKELQLTSFDPTHAEVIGLRPDLMRYGLLVALTLAVVVGVQAVGAVLISALLVTPAAAASLLTKRLPLMMVLACIISTGSSVVGLYASYHANVSSGAAIVLTCTLCFTLAWVFRAVRARV